MLTACAITRAPGAGDITSGPISAGKVVGVSVQDGIIVMKSGGTGNNISFSGMDRVPIRTASGRAVALSAVDPGMSITVHYVNKRGHWYVANAIIPDAAPTPATLPVTRGERRALSSKAANDNDITTQPGVKARLDRDITTQPAR